MANWVDEWVDRIMVEEEQQKRAEREFIRYWAMSFFEERCDDGIRRPEFLERICWEYGERTAENVGREIERISTDLREYIRYRFPSPAEYERLAREAGAW